MDLHGFVVTNHGILSELEGKIHKGSPSISYWFINLSNCAKNPTVRLAYSKTQKSPTKIHTLGNKNPV